MHIHSKAPLSRLYTPILIAALTLASFTLSTAHVSGSNGVVDVALSGQYELGSTSIETARLSQEAQNSPTLNSNSKHVPAVNKDTHSTQSSEGTFFFVFLLKRALTLGDFIVMCAIFVLGLSFGVAFSTVCIVGDIIVWILKSFWGARFHTRVMGLVVVTAAAVISLYYFRYHYGHSRRQSKRSGTKTKSNEDRPGTGFDLHPDITRSNDADYYSYASSSSSPQDRRASGRSKGVGNFGIGFPADFLNVFMKSISIFGYIEESVFHEFSRQLQTRRLLAGEVMFDGEAYRDDQNFYVVIDGNVQIYLVNKPASVAAAASPTTSFPNNAEDRNTATSRSDSFSDLCSESLFQSENNYRQAPRSRDSEGTDSIQDSSTVLLNEIGPGDVLSSLFSILSLFTEDVPLRHDSHVPPADTSAPPQADSLPGLNLNGISYGTRQETNAHSDHSLPNYQDSHFLRQAGLGGNRRPSPRAGPTSRSNPRTISTNARPNVIARATVDTTLAMIPSSAFQRVTRLYPKAASHILQVILTRLHRVTFATLYDYLDVPQELVSIEQNVAQLAHYPLQLETTHIDVLKKIRDLCYQSSSISNNNHDEARQPHAHPNKSSTSGSAENNGVGGNGSVLGISSAAEIAHSYSWKLGSPGLLQQSWKITRPMLAALHRERAQTTSDSSRTTTHDKLDHQSSSLDMTSPILGPADEDFDGSLKAAMSPRTSCKNSYQTHRRTGSDPASTVDIPTNDQLDSLRNNVLHHLCLSIGLDPNSPDGRYPLPPSQYAVNRMHSSSDTSTPQDIPVNINAQPGYKYSMQQKLPRTETLLPFLQDLGTSSPGNHRQTETPPLPLSEIPSLIDELELYHIPPGYSLIEQGQRPGGLYFILDGSVEITPREPSGSAGLTDDLSSSLANDDSGASSSRTKHSRLPINELTRRMADLAHDANIELEAQTQKQKRPYAAAQGGMAGGRRGLNIDDSLLKNAKHYYNSYDLSSASPRRSEPRTQSPQSVHSYTLGAGNLVGYMPALCDMASLYTAQSTSHVIVGFISRWALDRICDRYPITLMTLSRRITSQLPPIMMNIDYALEWVHVKASQMIYRKGDINNAVYVVVSGRLRAFAEKDDGSINIIAEYGQRQSIGEPNLLLNKPCAFNLHAIRDTELVRISTTLFKALIMTEPRLTFHLSRLLAIRTAQSLEYEQTMQKHQRQLQKTLNPRAQPSTDERRENSGGMRSHNKNLKSVAIIPVSADVPVHAFSQQLEEVLTGSGEPTVLLDHTTFSRVLGKHVFSKMARLKIGGWIAELEQHCRLILHVADGGINSPWTRHCIRHADFILLVGLGDDGDTSVGEFERLLLALKTTARKELVLLHSSRYCSTGSTREWLKHRPWVHAHHHVQMPFDFVGDYVGFSTRDSSQADNNNNSNRGGSGAFGVLRMLVRSSFWRSSTKVIPAPTRTKIDQLRTSIEKYYNRLRKGSSHKNTPAAYQGHRSDFARLARYLCGKSVGIVMSGGGARGIALLGVLRAFEEAGIPVDMVGGTSIGAFMSGLYAQNSDTVAILGRAKAYSRRMSSMWRFLLDVTYPILAYTSGREFNRTIWKVFKDTEIEDLWLPFYCMTANITRSQAGVHVSGLLWKYVRASMSLSGFVPPLCDDDGNMLVDGGYLDNLPVKVMKNELGADIIFAIDIAGENDTSPVKYGSSVSGFWVLLNQWNPFRSYRIPNLSEVQSRLSYCSSDKELENAKVADTCVYLRVPPRDVGVLDFGRFDELYKRGYEYGKEWTTAWTKENLLAQWQRSSHSISVPQGTEYAEGGSMPVPAAYRLTRRNSI